MNVLYKFSTIITFAVLSCIVASSLLINNLKFDFYPHGPDEQSYIGAANRMVLFENKELTVFFPQADNLVPYILGMVSKYFGIDAIIIFRIANIAINIAIILLFYLVGRKLSGSAALILASLSAFCISTTFWLGPAYMVPSTIILAVIPFLILLLLESRYVIASLVFAGAGLLYWWALAPLGIFILLYAIFLSKRRFIFLAIFFALFGLTSRFFLNDLIQKTIGSEGKYPAWYGDALLKYILPYAIVSILAAILFIAKKKHLFNAFRSKVVFIAVSLILTNVSFLIFFNEQTQARTFYFLLFGLFILSALSFDILLRIKQLKRFFVLSFVLFFIFFQVMINTALNNKNDVLKEVQLTSNEYAAMKWLKKNTDNRSVVLSDWGSMILSSYYLNNLNYHISSNDSNRFNRIRKLLNQGVAKKEDDEYVEKIFTENNLVSVYLLISLRTCYWFDYSQKNILFSRELPAWYTSCSSSDLQKFDAPLIYHNDEVYIYQLI